MKRVTALLCALVLLFPSLASATIYQTFFPPIANFAIEIDAPAGDSAHHQLLGVNLLNLDLFAVLMLSDGQPSAPTGRPWLYGRVTNVEQLAARRYRVTWAVSTSTGGGANAVFTSVGTIVITFDI